MNDSEVARQLAELVSAIVHEPVDPDAADARLVEDYGANSMDVVDIVERVERRFGVKITNDEMFSLATFGDLLALVVKGLCASDANEPSNGGNHRDREAQVQQHSSAEQQPTG